MMLTYICKNCGRRIESPNSLAGETEICPDCRTSNTIPTPDRRGPTLDWINELFEEVDIDLLAEPEAHEFGEDEGDREVEGPTAILVESAGVENATAPVPQPTSPTECDEESIGTFPKVLLGTLGALGIAMGVYLIYTAVRRPESPNPPAPAPVAVKAKNDKPKAPAPATKPPSKPLAEKVPEPAGLGAFDEAERRRAARDAKLQALAIAGGKPLDRAATEELTKAWAAMDRKDWNAAEKILTSLRKTQKDNPFVWLALGYLNTQLGNHEIAVAMYKTGIALKPDYAKAHFNLGLAYLHLKRYTDAIAAYKTAIAFNPNYATAYYNMGITYGRLGRYTDAITAYKKAITIKPDYAEANYNMGVSYLHLKRYTDAIAAYKKAIAINPDYAGVYLCLGVVYERMERYADAVAAYKGAVEKNPTYPYTHIRLFLVRARMGRDGKADLAKFYRMQKDEGWVTPVLRMYLGEITPKECLAAAAHKDADIDKEQKCEAYYYVGKLYLMRGDNKSARYYFERCVATDMRNFLEYGGAKTELERLWKE